MPHLALQSVEQLAFADVVVINKTDLVSEDERAALKQRIKVRRCHNIAMVVMSAAAGINGSMQSMIAFASCLADKLHNT